MWKEELRIYRCRYDATMINSKVSIFLKLISYSLPYYYISLNLNPVSVRYRIQINSTVIATQHRTIPSPMRLKFSHSGLSNICISCPQWTFSACILTRHLEQIVVMMVSRLVWE